MSAPREDLADLLPVALAVVRDNLHLYSISVAYWVLVGLFLATRYLLRRPAASDRLGWPIVGVGVLAAVVALVDVAVRGQAGITHVSLVAYLATPIGVGRYLIARWDQRAPGPFAALAMRATTYVTAFGMFVALGALAGTPWSLERPQIDRSSPEALIEGTDWMPFLATVFGLLLLADLVTSVASAGSERARARR